MLSPLSPAPSATTPNTRKSRRNPYTPGATREPSSSTNPYVLLANDSVFLPNLGRVLAMTREWQNEQQASSR